MEFLGEVPIATHAVSSTAPVTVAAPSSVAALAYFDIAQVICPV